MPYSGTRTLPDLLGAVMPLQESSALSIEQAMAHPFWDATFWDALAPGEEAAKKALLDLYENSYEGEECSCDTCVVRTILENIWPVLTQQVERIVALSQPVQTMGGCSNGSCRCRKE